MAKCRLNHANNKGLKGPFLVNCKGEDVTNNQRKFCDEYLVDCNATRAYRAAFKRCKTDGSAAVEACKLLKKSEIKEYINEQLEKLHDEKVADAQEVLEYLTSVMRGKSVSEVVVVEMVEKNKSKARRIKKLPDEKDQTRAAELLAKRYGLFKEKALVEGDVKLTIEVDYGEN